MMVKLVEWGWDSNWVMSKATLRDYYEILYEKLRQSAIDERMVKDANNN